MVMIPWTQIEQPKEATKTTTTIKSMWNVLVEWEEEEDQTMWIFLLLLLLFFHSLNGGTDIAAVTINTLLVLSQMMWRYLPLLVYSFGVCVCERPPSISFLCPATSKDDSLFFPHWHLKNEQKRQKKLFLFWEKTRATSGRSGPPSPLP